MRERLLDRVRAEIGDRKLVFFGTRGEDVESLTDTGCLAAVYSLIGTYRRRTGVQSGSLEDLTGSRPDLDTFDIDAELRVPEVNRLREAVLRSLARPSVLVTYRPSGFLSAIAFARAAQCQYLGMFSGHQAAFEYKPWVESSLRSLGIPHIPWTYIADADRREVLQYLRSGPVMMRRSRTNGGVGLVRLDDESDLARLWPDEPEGFVSVAPFISDAVPVNISAVVWRDAVTVHPLSMQLIGVPNCTTRPYGYCGNDFAAARLLDPATVNQIESGVRLIGQWLRDRGYLGAFGVDFMVRDGVPLFTEVNARLQGSTHLSSQISVELGLPCVLLDHVAACLGLDAPAGLPSLAELVQAAPTLAHLIVHSAAAEDRTIDATPLLDPMSGIPSIARADVRASQTLSLAPNATIIRLVFRAQITSSGFDLESGLQRGVDEFTGRYLTGVRINAGGV